MYTRRNRLEYKVRRFVGRLKIVLDRRRSHFYFDKKNKRIVISERYQKIVKLISRCILLASIITSFVALPAPYSIIVSLGLIFLEQLIERVVYSFQTGLLVPFPDFDTWKKAGFLNMMFAKFGKESPHVLGMIFSDARYAKEVWGFIEGWNYGKANDKRSNNVSVSFVINEKKNAYAFFVYPSYDCPSVKAAKRKLQKGREDQEQILLVGQMIMCRVFPFKNSAFQRMFLPIYKPGEEYLLSCWVMDDPPVEVAGTQRIEKNDLKIKNVNDLTRKDIEYHMAKYSIDWDNPGSDKPSVFYTK